MIMESKQATRYNYFIYFFCFFFRAVNDMIKKLELFNGSYNFI